ncbi:site-specific DNA-methyltransferase [Acinetobacter sp. CFCC 10889]|uniref:site-specific DNA-methyltransferase n=1 Tax=Acinetobacter sp. CFCC 10889 TaxID=1775557 RepID=UPI000DCF9B3F|nr:site-specific DNA-methyltransferase [Acinetobacter sp. CFCC 10889]
MSKTKLELTWIGKDKRPRLEPRILLEDPSKSYYANSKVSENDIFDNKLIFGDNLLALKALEREYAGKVKCIFIDPPYNTGSAFSHYDDGLEHSIWLGLMRDRLEILKSLLAEDGSIWISLDNNEVHYLKVLCDEIFGRANYLGDLIWKKRKGGGNDSQFFAVDHDYILAYLKNNDKKLHTKKWRVPQTEEYLKRYKETDENGERYYWDTLARNGLKNPIPIELEAPDGSKVIFNSQKGLDTIEKGLKTGHIKFTHTKNGWTLHHRVYMPEGQVLRSILDQVGTNKDSSDEMEQIFGNKKAFDYPKPESLIESILNLATNSEDLVLDSFAGSGTTGAVAHKMGRRWIMVELGEHCHTHVIPRLQKVIDGEDKGGVTESTSWQGGGGFRYYKLAPSLMKKDQWDNWVINPEYNQEMLVEAMCKLEGYTYTPSETEYWNHGKGSETDFIYVTTQTLTDQQLQAISEEVGEGRTLLIIASAWRCKNIDRFINLTLKKIPNSIIKACEWGHDDYSLNVQNLPMSEPDIEEKPKVKKVKNTQEQGQVTGDLFGDQT